MAWLSKDDDCCRILVIEIDEHSHDDRDSSCEARRLSEQFIALQTAVGVGATVPILFLRYNPDAYDGGRVSGEDRLAQVAAVGRRFLYEGGWREINVLLPAVKFMFYHSSAQKHIDYLRERPDAVAVID